MLTIESWFRAGMKRALAGPLPLNMKRALDLGCGNACTPGAQGLDWPEWDGALGHIPAEDNSVTAIIAHHFLEHLTGTQAIAMLREAERVLIPGGVMSVVTPYYSAQLQADDLTHKSAWNESTWKTLFINDYYLMNREVPWRLSVHTCFIIGIVERNLALFTQLIKDH